MARRGLVAALAIPGAILVAIGAVIAERDGLEAGLGLADLAAGEGPSPLKLVTAAPVRAEIGWNIDGRAGLGDLYRPADARADLVLVPGAAAEGRDHPKLRALALTLARLGFSVLVPELPNLRALKLSPADARAIADAALALASRDGGRPQKRPLGLGAISYAVGPAVLAGLEPDLAGRIDFILGLGGYYDATAVVRYFTTGKFRSGNERDWRELAPNRYGKWVFVRANADRLPPGPDRSTLAAIAARKLADGEADIADLSMRLGENGRAVLALIDNREPERVTALVAALPAAIRADMEGLDLARRDLTGLTARLILIHGRDDRIVPFSESQALAAALPAGQAKLFLLDSLMHAELSPSGAMDAITLWRAMRRLLSQRR